MRAIFYKALTKFCSIFGFLGSKLQSWAEFKEWEYWNDEQCQIIELPEDVHVFLYYNRNGDNLKIAVTYWPMVNGSYDWNNRPEVMRQEFTREEIQELGKKEIEQ